MDRDTFSNSNTRDKFIPFDNKDVPLKAKFTIAKPNETEYLMGVENFVREFLSSGTMIK